MSNCQYPYVICHMLQSIDGKIAGSFFETDATLSLGKDYARISQEYNGDAIVYGRTTADEIFTHGQHFNNQLHHQQKIEKKDFVYMNEKSKWIVVVDPQGTLCWSQEALKNERLKDKNVIEVLSENVDDAYLEHLRTLHISYIFAGKDQLSMRVVLKKLKSQFHISKVLLQGGGIVNQSFVEENLVDELSVMISPVIGGESQVPTSFEGTFVNHHCARSFHLKKVEMIKQSGLWLNYIKKENDFYE